MTTDKEARLARLLRLLVWGGALFVWLIPVVAKLTINIPWTTFDFIAWAVMLLIAASICEVALRLSGRLAYRAAVIVAVGTSFLITWSNLAVGIIGDENNPLNQIFFGVIAIAVVGAVVARFRAKGMALAMAVTAVAQFGTGFIALMDEQIVFGIVTVFALGWLLSAGLFREAARAEADTA